MLYLIGCLVLVVAAGSGGFILGGKLKQRRHHQLIGGMVAKELEHKEALLLGPGGGPEGGETVIQRLRQFGFTVLEKRVEPRVHMLGWFYTHSVADTCTTCNRKLLMLHEISEMKGHSVAEAFLVAASKMGLFCNTCGGFRGFAVAKSNEEAQASCSGKLEVGFLWPVLQKAHACNLFDILDHLQASRKMNEKFCEWLEERRQLLCREAEKISSTISRHQLSTAKDISDDPYRNKMIPE